MATTDSSSPSESGVHQLRIATRESPLAMWQAEHVADLIATIAPRPAIIAMVSSGDVDMRPIDGKRSIGVFTKRIQQALLDGDGDLAVHSMKDLPTEGHPRLRLIASPARETVADRLVSPEGKHLNDLPAGARVGTGSRRRAAQLLRLRPDLNVLPIRGNVQTRLKKMNDGEYDAIVLAAAGLERLKMGDAPSVEFSLDEMLPAPGQGALAIEVRCDDEHAIEVVRQIDVADTSACTHAERTLLSRLHGGCLAPIAALATIASDQSEITLKARVLSLDGTNCLEESASRSIELQSEQFIPAAERLGTIVADALLARGAKQLIEAGR